MEPFQERNNEWGGSPPAEKIGETDLSAQQNRAQTSARLSLSNGDSRRP
jgi:hypothetical protein